MSTMRFGPYSVETSNPDKVLFPDARVTKAALVDYYKRVAERMLPHIQGRPITMHRFPDGLEEDGFYQQNAPDYLPKWAKRVSIEAKQGKTVNHLICENAATLVYIANQACITPHVWLSKTDKLHKPDRMIFDLDPPDKDFEAVRWGALRLKELLEDLGLVPFVMTTGSRGHIVVPIQRLAVFDTVRAFAKEVVRALVSRHPNRLTDEQRKDKRGRRLFIDVMRNVYGQTAVPPYAVRPTSTAAVATPLDWEELSNSDLNSQRYTLKNIFKRLGQKNELWKGMSRNARSLRQPRKRLDDLVRQS